MKLANPFCKATASDNCFVEDVIDQWRGCSTDPLPIFSPDKLLAHSAVNAEVDAIRGYFANAPEFYKHCVYPIIREVADLAQLFPASQRHHHRDPLGLLLHSMDVCRRLLSKTKRSRDVRLDKQPPSVSEEQPYDLLCAVLQGLCHDLGKIRTDMLIKVYSGSTRPPADYKVYGPCFVGEPYSMSLREFANHEFGHSGPEITYRVFHIKGRKINKHASQTIFAMDAVLKRADVSIPIEVREFFLERRRMYARYDMERHKRQADSASVRDDLIECPVRNSDLEENCLNIIRYFASVGDLADLPCVQGHRFISLMTLDELMQNRPVFIEFRGVPVGSDAKILMHDFKSFGFHVDPPSERDCTYPFAQYGNEYGLFLSKRITSEICFYERYPTEYMRIEKDFEVPSEVQTTAHTSCLSLDQAEILGVQPLTLLGFFNFMYESVSRGIHPMRKTEIGLKLGIPVIQAYVKHHSRIGELAILLNESNILSRWTPGFLYLDLDHPLVSEVWSAVCQKADAGRQLLIDPRSGFRGD